MAGEGGSVTALRTLRASVSAFLVGVLLGAQLSPVSATDNLEREWIYLPNGCYDNYVRYNYGSPALPSQGFRDAIGRGKAKWGAVGRELFFSKQTTDIRVWIYYQQPGGGYEYALAVATLNAFPWWEVHNATIDFNPHYDGSWYWGVSTPVPPDKYDVQSVATHEFGHLVALKHTSQSANDVMWGGGLDTGQARRTLTTHDKDGIKYFYPAMVC